MLGRGDRDGDRFSRSEMLSPRRCSMQIALRSLLGLTVMAGGCRSGAPVAEQPPAATRPTFVALQTLTAHQRLVLACHRLDVNGVRTALREGADVNARFGRGDTKLFQNPWTLGWPMAAGRWTPLIALASASDYPAPPRKVANTVEDLDWARDEKAKVPAEQIERRRTEGLTIARILLSRNADVNADDGYGATALYAAVYKRKLELAKLLLRHDADVNTRTGIYIDGAGDITPLHRAYWSPELTKLL